MTCCLKALQRCSKLPRNLVTFVLYRIHSVPRISWTLSNVQEAFIEDFFFAFSFGDIQETLSFGLLKLGFLQYARSSARHWNKKKYESSNKENFFLFISCRQRFFCIRGWCSGEVYFLEFYLLEIGFLEVIFTAVLTGTLGCSCFCAATSVNCYSWSVFNIMKDLGNVFIRKTLSTSLPATGFCGIVI